MTLLYIFWYFLYVYIYIYILIDLHTFIHIYIWIIQWWNMFHCHYPRPFLASNSSFHTFSEIPNRLRTPPTVVTLFAGDRGIGSINQSTYGFYAERFRPSWSDAIGKKNWKEDNLKLLGCLKIFDWWNEGCFGMKQQIEWHVCSILSGICCQWLLFEGNSGQMVQVSFLRFSFWVGRGPHVLRWMLDLINVSLDGVGWGLNMIPKGLQDGRH